MKAKKHPRGPWQATGVQRERLAKGDPAKLRMRATELKLKAESLIKRPTDWKHERKNWNGLPLPIQIR